MRQRLTDRQLHHDIKSIVTRIIVERTKLFIIKTDIEIILVFLIFQSYHHLIQLYVFTVHLKSETLPMSALHTRKEMPFSAELLRHLLHQPGQQIKEIVLPFDGKGKFIITTEIKIQLAGDQLYSSGNKIHHFIHVLLSPFFNHSSQPGFIVRKPLPEFSRTLPEGLATGHRFRGRQTGIQFLYFSPGCQLFVTPSQKHTGILIVRGEPQYLFEPFFSLPEPITIVICIPQTVMPQGIVLPFRFHGQ